MSIKCLEGHCPYMFQCISQACQHDNIFPLTVYTSFVYLLLTFGVMMCNVGGLSAGIFKVPILMDLLNYPVNVATTLSYPIVTGAALSNFIQLIPKRHPRKETSLVDYNIVLVLIPCVSFGTTLGVIIVKFIPLLYQDIILIIVFIMFTVFFSIKIKNFDKDNEKVAQQLQKHMIQLGQNTNRQDKLSAVVSLDDPRMTSRAEPSTTPQVGINKSVNQRSYSNIDKLYRVLQYEKTHHIKDILISIAVFAVFEVLALLAQGKIVSFSFCSWQFGVSFVSLCLVFSGYMYFVHRTTVKKLQQYKQIGYDYDVKLDDSKIFMIIAGGGFVGGFLQGIIGVGSGNTMMASLLTCGINPKVASATSGYQILFIGLSSLIEALAYEEISWLEVGWLFGICLVFGGAFTFGLYWLIKDRPKGHKIILAFILALCVICIVGVLPSIYLTQLYYGWPFMLDLPTKFCSV